jgi:ferredoxin
LHVIDTGFVGGREESRLSPWLQAGAALEGRAHPFLLYNPEGGRSWAKRMDFSENPEAESDWPRYPFSYRSSGTSGPPEQMALAFTFADFALLDPALREHYRLVPDGFAREELVPLDSYLELEPSSTQAAVPFVWAVDTRSVIRRAVVSRELLLACLDRLQYWRTLQELAGIHNEYAETAAEEARGKARAEAEAERERLEAAHAEEVARVREETAGEVMERLTQTLLGLDLSRTLVAQGPAQRTVPAAEEAPAAEAPGADASTDQAVAEAEAEEEEVSFDKPWIDSMLCTSCNDCMKINQRLFVYNENKQAMISDPKLGTFKDLVLAAEKCPARCIHPGKPQNPDEPGLDELIERAKPFN